MAKTAIILGATGLTGSLVLEQLISNSDYDKIKLFSRKPSEVKNDKIEEFIVDVLDLDKAKADFTADEVYCCIGTTKKKTPDQEMYAKIDLGIPAKVAQLCKENGINFLAVVSAIGADSKSKIFYNRTKGLMEEAVFSEGIEHTYILRPSLITGDRKEKRFGEKVGMVFFKILNPLMIGGLRKYRSVEAKKIASKMIALANSDLESGVIESNEI